MSCKIFKDGGAKIAFGTDYPVEPINPLEGLYAAVTQKDRAGEQGDGWFPDRKLGIEEAIELYTLGSAYAEFMEDHKGIIKEGYLGDVVIFNEDMKSQASLKYNGAVNVNHNLKGFSHGNVLHWSRRAQQQHRLSYRTQRPNRIEIFGANEHSIY